MNEISPEIFENCGSNPTEQKHKISDVPTTLYRGERIYLDNIDQLGKRNLSTVDHENTHNKDGKVYLARDEKYANSYSIGKDGVTWYDNPLPKEEIPIGVIYEISNPDNIIGAVAEGDPLPNLPQLGDLAGKHREFITDSIPFGQYNVKKLQIMDDYIQPDGHRRSDAREILEEFTVDNQEQLPQVIEAVKKRINELDEQRQIK